MLSFVEKIITKNSFTRCEGYQFSHKKLPTNPKNASSQTHFVIENSTNMCLLVTFTLLQIGHMGKPMIFSVVKILYCEYFFC